MKINLIELKKLTVRLLLIFPLLASVYCIQKILRSSQDGLSKAWQTVWFSLAILISETAFEFPQLFTTSLEDEEESRGQGPGLYLLLQICHILAFIMVYGYHSFSYTFLLNYCPNHIFFANVPIILFILSILTYVRHSDLVHVVNRIHELFTGFVMIYICGMAGNYFGCVGGIIILFGFFSVKKPTWSVELDQVFWFFIGVYLSIVILSLTIYEMIEKPVVLHSLNFFDPTTPDSQSQPPVVNPGTGDLVITKQVAQVIEDYYAKEKSGHD